MEYNQLQSVICLDDPKLAALYFDRVLPIIPQEESTLIPGIMELMSSGLLQINAPINDDSMSMDVLASLMFPGEKERINVDSNWHNNWQNLNHALREFVPRSHSADFPLALQTLYASNFI